MKRSEKNFTSLFFSAYFIESDNAVTVVVSPLDADGGKVVYSGDDATLTCTAMSEFINYKIVKFVYIGVNP